jgi:class 3 adenylate cyclase
MAIRRNRWFDVVAKQQPGQVVATDVRLALADLDETLFSFWALGHNIILVWTQDSTTLRFMAVRHYSIAAAVHAEVNSGAAAQDTHAFMNSVLAGPKFVDQIQFDSIRRTLGDEAQLLELRFPAATHSVMPLISSLVTRYGVTLGRGKAVVLLDAVGFSLGSPLEQVAMLNSLGYSVNSAYNQLLSKGVDVNFARTTTGDGFYIWNRANDDAANIALYELMMLILADNAVARRKARGSPVPHLRAAFHVGEHYEFYQVEALNPTTFGYIVGHVTIELARMLAAAQPGQILLGDFTIEHADGSSYGTPEFVERTARSLDQLKGLAIADDRLSSVSCYLTGSRSGDGRFAIERFPIEDKHGATRLVYNAKVNIHCEHAAPLFLGLQHKDIKQATQRDSLGPIV